jgi:hypothetical protein
MALTITKDNNDLTIGNVSTTEKNVERRISQSSKYNVFVKPAKVTTYTVGGTFQVDDVFTITLNSVDFAHTVVGGDTDNDGIATALALLVDADANYTSYSTASVVYVTAADPFNEYTVATSAVNGGATDDQTLVAAVINPSIVVVPYVKNTSSKTENRAWFFLPIVSGGNNTISHEFYTLDIIKQFPIPLEIDMVYEFLRINFVGEIYDNIWVNIEPGFDTIATFNNVNELVRRVT